jgi:predicted ester cyclase
MSTENKANVRQFCAEVINAGHTDRVEEVVTADDVERQHVPGAEGRQGIEVAKAFLSLMRRAFPTNQFDVEDLLAAADEVVARLTVSGAHRGEMLGRAPTGTRVRTSGIEVVRFVSGKMAEHSAPFDALGWRRLSGIVPIPGPTLLARTLVSHVRKAPSHRALREVKPC